MSEDVKSEDSYKRLTAFRVPINYLLSAPLNKEGDSFEYLAFKDLKVSRVRIVATIVSKKINDDRSYAYLVLDDGTETMRVKCWKEDVEKLEKPIVGDIIEIIGRVREWNSERYLSCESLHVVSDPNHWLYHEFELLMSKEKFERVNEKVETGVSTGVEKKESSDIKKEDLVLKIIKDNDIGKGTSFALIQRESKLDEAALKEVLSTLLNDSVIYEPQKNSYKLLE
ncbi:OB-fold nucleic acid binding domain protein [Candidatus Tiddalikarchaeum anstoanum]|nr:OB-fold nucleic acid binding domain protein [Candidatus Tiddalikarchaeum anstoanum]